MKKFKNAFDYDPKDIKNEVNESPSMTVPDMTMSLQELLKRYTRGGEVATFQPVYQQTDDFENDPDISKMDATEKLEYARQIRESISEYQRNANRNKTANSADPAKPQDDQETDSSVDMDSEKNPVKGTSHNSP
ncbi:MAG: hypothetical protein QXT77_07540 [Candidatus Methanomethylicaceae archaeon]